MTTTVDIPGGEVTLRNPRALTERQRRLLTRVQGRMGSMLGKIRAAGFDPDADDVESTIDAEKLHFDAEDVDLSFELNDAGIIAFVQSWTLDLPLPTMETVTDLPGDLYSRLQEITAPLIVKVIIDSAGFEPQPDNDSPTPP